MRKHGEKLIEEINKERQPHHNTVYCSAETYRSIERTMSAGISGTRSIDNVRVAGLEIITHQAFGDAVIVCKRGEVFPLTKHFKDEQV